MSRRLLEHDLRWAQALHRGASSRWLLAACRLASRLGDGMLWYGLMLVLPLVAGDKGWACARHMLLAGLASLVLYKVLKHASGRPRPFRVCPGIRCQGRVLDEFSFPSGHTFHAVGFSLVLAYHFPVGAAALVPFTVLVALSRVVLGLHYPSDVLAGAVLGTVVGLVSIWIL